MIRIDNAPYTNCDCRINQLSSNVQMLYYFMCNTLTIYDGSSNTTPNFKIKSYGFLSYFVGGVHLIRDEMFSAFAVSMMKWCCSHVDDNAEYWLFDLESDYVVIQ